VSLGPIGDDHGPARPIFGTILSISWPRSRIFYVNPVGSLAPPGEPKRSCPKISVLPRCTAASPPLPHRASQAPPATHFRKVTRPCSFPPARRSSFPLSANYWILKAYNNSDSYALSPAWPVTCIIPSRVDNGSCAERAPGTLPLAGRFDSRFRISSATKDATPPRRTQRQFFFSGFFRSSDSNSDRVRSVL
jgi:hypothetical protein